MTLQMCITKITNLLHRCDNGAAELSLTTDKYIRCKLPNGSWLEEKDLHTLLEEKGIKIIRLFSKNNNIYIDLDII